MNNFKYILDLLPYEKPFLFVDQIRTLSEEGVEGDYHFSNDEYFYKGHFKNNPITPGVILTECMAQIGVVCLGVYLFKSQGNEAPPKIALSSAHIDYYLPVMPGTLVSVISEKIYFRFGKLKCKVKMLNDKKELVCKGTISGMIAP